MFSPGHLDFYPEIVRCPDVIGSTAYALEVDDISIARGKYKHLLQAKLTHNVSALDTWRMYVYKLLHTYVPCN